MSIPTPRMVIGNSEGESMKLNWNFQRGGGGCSKQTTIVGEV